FYCTPGSASAVSVRINWLRFISSFNTEVTFLADDQEPLTLKLGVDRSNKVTATRAAEDDKAIIAALSGQQMLLIRVTPYSEAPVEVKFDLDELDAGLAKLRQACTDAN
ncbi:MAG: hypothetical protein HKN35_13490, partial [Woeseia sp.]|nr:hypothetical protein [Woeseia sp.]